jgi:hypothetical protein
MRRNGRLGIYAVYYDEDQNIDGWSESPFSPEADDLEELKTTLGLMLESLEKDIVEYKSETECTSSE